MAATRENDGTAGQRQGARARADKDEGAGKKRAVRALSCPGKGGNGPAPVDCVPAESNRGGPVTGGMQQNLGRCAGGQVLFTFDFKPFSCLHLCHWNTAHDFCHFLVHFTVP